MNEKKIRIIVQHLVNWQIHCGIFIFILQTIPMFVCVCVCVRYLLVCFGRSNTLIPPLSHHCDALRPAHSSLRVNTTIFILTFLEFNVTHRQELNINRLESKLPIYSRVSSFCFLNTVVVAGDVLSNTISSIGNTQSSYIWLFANSTWIFRFGSSPWYSNVIARKYTTHHCRSQVMEKSMNCHFIEPFQWTLPLLWHLCVC